MDERADRFLALLGQHKGILHKLAYVYCRAPDERRDLIQEMVLQLWRSFGRYDERFKFSTWMYRVAMNVAISFVRGQPRHQLVPLDGLELADERTVPEDLQRL